MKKESYRGRVVGMCVLIREITGYRVANKIFGSYICPKPNQFSNYACRRPRHTPANMRKG